MSNYDLFEKFRQYMKLRNFSDHTIEIYTRYLSDCFSLTNTDPTHIDEDHIKKYLSHLQQKHVASSTLNTAYSALKLYFGQTRIQKKKVRNFIIPNKFHQYFQNKKLSDSSQLQIIQNTTR